MQTQLKIDFHGAEPPEALTRMIEEHVEALEHMYGRLTACHVSVEPPGHHQHKGGLYNVRIRLALPDGREVNAGITPREDKRNADVLFAVSDAFRRAKRQMQDRAREMRGQVKVHEHAPTGKIARFDPNTGYGFIEADDGHEIYFHQNSVVDGIASDIRPGVRVTFVEEMGEMGPQASTVHHLGKHGLR